MKHLKEGSTAWRIGHGRSLSQVRVVLQHETIGTLFDDGSRVMQAWHGELHETREQAEEYIWQTQSVIGRQNEIDGDKKIVHVR